MHGPTAGLSLRQTSRLKHRSFPPNRNPAVRLQRASTRGTAHHAFMRAQRALHRENDAAQFEWRVLFVAGMWFQDLFNYDFRRTEMCIIPYGTQLGEISFCAYNTGAGWRNVIEKMKANATVAEWYARHGRHPVHAKNKDLPLPEFDHPVTVREHESALAERSSGERPAPPPKRKRLKHLPVIEG